MQTPMSRMQQSFKDFGEVSQKYTLKTELVGQDSKYNSYSSSESRGVESDFIRIYQDKTSPSNSFAFAFNNYKTNIEDTQVTVSVIKNKVHTSTHMSLPKFQELFKEFLKVSKILQASGNACFTSLATTLVTVFKVDSESAVNYQLMAEDMFKLIQAEVGEFETLAAKTKLVTDSRRKLETEIYKKVREYEKQIEQELGYTALVKKEKKLNDETTKLKESAINKLNHEITAIKDKYKFLTYRAIKNSLSKSVAENITKKNYSLSSFWSDVFGKAVQNNQLHKDK